MAPTSAQHTLELVITVVSAAHESLTVDFFALPKPAQEAIGEIRVDWGDGRVSAPDLVITDGELSEMLNTPTLAVSRTCSHTYASDGKRTVRILAPAGWLPLKRLPEQTLSIDSALPTLTQGQTDSRLRVLASDTLPRLCFPRQMGSRAMLNAICPELLKSNPQLAYFDEAFFGTSLKQLPAGLFAPCAHLASLVRTFAYTALEAVPALSLAAADDSTLCEETFAYCERLAQVANPFAEGVVPVVAERFLESAPSHVFDWCPRDRREEMGWVRPQATVNDPSFDFVWVARDLASHTVLSFYPIDLELKGDLLIDWGDGQTERIDWNETNVVNHSYGRFGKYVIKVHSTANEPVRPFRLGGGVQSIVSKLPIFHPRTVDHRGDLCGWACDLRELERIEVPLFVDNGSITDLTQAFAGCVRLAHVPDDILEGLGNVSVDGMFAFCKSLQRLPAQYVASRRDASLDCFSPTVRAQPSLVPHIDDDAP